MTAINDHYCCQIHRRGTYLKTLAESGLVASRVLDLTQQAIPYWELRSHSKLKTGVEEPFLVGYRKNHLNYLVIAAEKSVIVKACRIAPPDDSRHRSASGPCAQS